MISRYLIFSKRNKSDFDTAYQTGINSVTLLARKGSTSTRNVRNGSYLNILCMQRHQNKEHIFLFVLTADFEVCQGRLRKVFFEKLKTS